jgi:phosphoribosylamine--glycine ligase
VVEEFLTGPEVSVLAFTDGTTLVPMVSSMDHKRIYDNDEGPNTGGMGVVAPNPFYTDDIAEGCMRTIFLPTLEAMRKEGAPFRGCLYFGLMLTQDGPRVIEYNCRLGDPETQVALELLDGDLLAAMRACTDGTLAPDTVRIREGAAACVVMASGGYPGSYQKDKPIEGIEQAGNDPDVRVYHAGTRLAGGLPVTSGGRVLGVTARAGDLPSALGKAYAAAAKIRFEGAHYRKDIGARALQALRR